MFISLNWLKDYVEIPEKYSASDLVKLITLHSCEVEGIIDQKSSFANIVAAKILEIEPHPDADKLQIPTVDTGKEKIKVVCGAQNIKVGQIIPFAMEGAKVLHDGEKFEIKKVKIRGVESRGMLCSARELGFSDDHAGIMILPENVMPGTLFADIYGLNDIVLEIDNKSLTHRPDLWGHIGIARELSAILNTKFIQLELDELKVGKNEESFEVKVDDSDLCPRYMGLVLKGIEVKESSEEIKQRLTAVGMRPINNIVDITNYVMLEMGQPLHAFDMKKIAGKKIVVRRAKPGEKIITLDGEKRELNNDNLLIADSDGPIAIAGVMGGENSEISDETTEIFLESANFEASNNRQTATQLGLRTEAVMRYEKSLDPALSKSAMERVVALIKESCPKAYLASELYDLCAWQDPELKLKISPAEISAYAGVSLDEKKIKEILTRLGFLVDSKLNVKVPSWRASKDISSSVDLIEEVLRIYGYENIPYTLPRTENKPPIQNNLRELEREAKRILVSSGMYEVINFSFVCENLINKLGGELGDYITLRNPLASDQTMLRKSLLPNLVLAAQSNLRFQDKIRIFEYGSVFFREPGELVADSLGKEKLPLQKKLLSALLTGDFYEAKKVLETLFTKLKVKVSYVKINDARFSTAAELRIDDVKVAVVGTLSRKSSANFDLDETSFFELELESLLVFLSSTVRFKALPKFPSVKRDLAALFSENTEVNNVLEKLKALSPLISEVKLFDLYRGKGVPDGKKSLAFNLIYQDLEKTLEESEIASVHEKVLTEIAKLGGEIRS